MDETNTEALKLLIGRHIFDGASPEQIAQMHDVSVDAANQAWFHCRERLSKHYAHVEERGYKLLSDNDLQARLHKTLQLLLEWRDYALQAERFARTEVQSLDPISEDEEPPSELPDGAE